MIIVACGEGTKKKQKREETREPFGQDQCSGAKVFSFFFGKIWPGLKAPMLLFQFGQLQQPTQRSNDGW